MKFKEWLKLQEYNQPRDGMKSRWSMTYKKSINCNNPKGFSQKNYCKRKARGGHYKENINQHELTQPLFYHTTSIDGFMKILKEKQIKANPFASMSEKCLFHGDIQSGDVCIGIIQNKVQPFLMKVLYNPNWFNQNPEHAAYVAGEGWKEQFQYDPNYDDEEEDEDEDEYQKQYLEAELEAFLSKKEEREWVTKIEYTPITFHTDDVKIIVPANNNIQQQVIHLIQQMPEYQNATIKTK